jgi:hypothetical protein
VLRRGCSEDGAPGVDGGMLAVPGRWRGWLRQPFLAVPGPRRDALATVLLVVVLLVLGGGGGCEGQRRAGRRTAAGFSARPRTTRLPGHRRAAGGCSAWLGRRTGLAWEEDSAGRRTGLGSGGGASRRRWLAGGVQVVGRAEGGAGGGASGSSLLGSVDGEMRKRTGYG